MFNLQSKEKMSLFEHREEEISKLNCLVNQLRVPLLFVTGIHGTGKSSIVRDVVSKSNSDGWVWIDSAEFPSVKLIYRHVLSKLFPIVSEVKTNFDYSLAEGRATKTSLFEESFIDANEGEEIDLDFDTQSSCPSHLELIHQLIQRLDSLTEDRLSTEKLKYTIVVDNAELLIKFDSVLAVFTRLTELVECKANFSLIMISTHSFEYFRQSASLVIEPYTLTFNPYSQETLIKIIVERRPSGANRNLYER